MKASIAIFLLVLAVRNSLGEAPRLILVSSDTTIRQDNNISFDVYLYNDSKVRAKVPSLETISTYYALRDPTGVRLPRGGTSAQIFSHPKQSHSLPPNGVERTSIKIQIPAELGDLAEVYVELGRGDKPSRSNSVLLFRPTETPAK